ncbi:hypothetical protein ATANTOWER_015331, partial [Ataeniobius toweri]|nr:hypothetical protein [Ataeniobius toweri]
MGLSKVFQGSPLQPIKPESFLTALSMQKLLYGGWVGLLLLLAEYPHLQGSVNREYAGLMPWLELHHTLTRLALVQLSYCKTFGTAAVTCINVPVLLLLLQKQTHLA